jgi:aryl-alcohol dehydrogenase-like predicted oxidoreductase
MNNKIGIGSVQFGMNYGVSNESGQTALEEVGNILDFAQSNDIQYIDTASGYGNAEVALGNYDLSVFNVISKYIPPADAGSIQTQINESLSRLGLKSLYGYLSHRPTDLLQNPSQWAALQEVKAKGLTGKIGYSLNEPQELDALLKANMIADLIQVPYNLFDNRFENQMRELKSKGCEIHTRSTFLQGLFFVDADNLDPHFNQVASEIRQLQQQYGDQLSQYLLQYVISRDFIDVVVLGVENQQQLQSNIMDLENTKDSLKPPANPISETILMPSMWPKLK